MKWQFGGTWLAGSVAMGTVAVLLTAGRGDRPFRALSGLSGLMLFALLALVAVLFVALFAVGLRTEDVTWLPNDTRAAILWTAAVGGGGLIGWGFAAAVTFDAGFDLATQLILGYLGGGLPFTLIAAMFAKPVRTNAIAAGLTAIALLAGATLMDRPLQSCIRYLLLLFGPALGGQ
ncbi:hypothetical protein JOF56_010893 [Kibdelosporangium banguiense]|uniref:Uncharacterized protein n=1 Tax=Kibdelosporangium banguiense TaxID=1365924 RepID=A0ABS4U1I0_9PSEU|nr:hypothetical protein [Kibdelosporangium banguiense]MBP2330508.1 hypothetical protein [Kibdelosporangium banguiense]